MYINTELPVEALDRTPERIKTLVDANGNEIFKLCDAPIDAKNTLTNMYAVAATTTNDNKYAVIAQPLVAWADTPETIETFIAYHFAEPLKNLKIVINNIKNYIEDTNRFVENLNIEVD